MAGGRGALARPCGGAVRRVFVLVVVLHTAWDLSGSTASYVVLAVISLTLLAVTSHRLAAPHRRHHLPLRSAVPV